MDNFTFLLRVDIIVREIYWIQFFPEVDNSHVPHYYQSQPFLAYKLIQ
jgi:hypothetical protein